VKARLVALTSAVVTVAGFAGFAVAATTAAATHPPGRQSRTSGIAVAGANVYVWSAHRSERDGEGCTLSFVVRSRTTGRVGALTAGHCVGTLPGGPSYSVHQTRDVRSDTTDPGAELGAVSPGAYRFGRAGDSAYVSLAAGRIGRPAVYVGGPRSHRTIPVAGVGALHRGTRVCYSGAATGEHCGFRVVGHPGTISFPDRGRTYRVGHEWSAAGRTCTSRAGDSGSPVYTRQHGAAYAVGILSGGQKQAGRCPFVFTPVALALRHLDLSLVSASSPAPRQR
jgi:V8-like Glu-specific endopeptidase